MLIRRIWSRANRDERGTSVVEMAILTPLLLYITYAIIVYSLAMKADVTVTNAAREGARTLAVTHDYSLARQRAAEEITDTLRQTWGSDVIFDPNADVVLYTTGTYAVAEVSYQQPTIVPGLGMLLGGQPLAKYFDLREIASFRLEN